MRRHPWIVFGGAMVAGIAGFLIFRLLPAADVPEATPAPPPPAKVEAGLTILNDPVLVFQKAFWRRPSDDDRVHHAERREWADPAGELVRWSWYLSLSPGSDLVEWLETNPFSLATVSTTGMTFDRGECPDWFPHDAAGFQVQQSRGGHFTLMVSTDQNRLFATDSGVGFVRPQVEP